MDPACLARALMATGAEAESLRIEADAARREQFGDAVRLRGIIEFSNYCKNRCLYCGIRNGANGVLRYRIPDAEILQTAHAVRAGGCGTVVLQSGEDPFYTKSHLVDLVKTIKEETGLKITLSLGIRDRETLRALREAGADRYLLRFETSDAVLFEQIHPDAGFAARLSCLRDLRDLGYEVGSGFMIGLPGGTPESIARDLLFTKSLNLQMIGCGPFLSDPKTPMNVQPVFPHSLYYNTIALLRLMNPTVNLPATTSFDALEPGGRDRVLSYGANIFMPNMTPRKYRECYQLYPNKPGVDEDGSATLEASKRRLAAAGRTLDPQ